MFCCCCSTTISCLTPYNPTDGSTWGFPVLHYLLKFAQIHVHWVADAIQSFHHLPSPHFAFSLSQHHGLFQKSRFSHQGAIEVSAAVSALPKNVQGWFPIGLTSWSPCSPRDSLESSSAPHFESINSSALSLLYGPALTSTYDSCKNHQFSSVQLLSRVWTTPWTAARQASLSITNS